MFVVIVSLQRIQGEHNLKKWFGALALGLVVAFTPQIDPAEAANKTVKVDTSVLNVRAKATVKSSDVGNVYRNQKLTVYKKVGAWYQVKHHGKKRFVHASYTRTGNAKKATVSKPVSGGYKMTMNTSAYTAFCTGCSGITASGYNVKNTTTYNGYKIVAAGPQFPIGTKMYIPGFGNAIVLDRGGAIKGNKLDLLVASNGQAYNWGRKNVTVTIYR